MLTQDIEGTGSATNITAYSYIPYNLGNLVQEIDYPDGNWVYYEYDSYNRVIAKYSAFGNCLSPSVSGSPPSSSTSKYVYYDYNKVATDDDTVHNNPAVPRTERAYLPAGGGTIVSTIYRSSPVADEVEEWRYANPNPIWGTDPGLLTTTVTYIDPTDVNTFGRINWQVRPDGTATLYTYQEDTNAVLTNIVVQVGAPNNTSIPTAIIDGTQASEGLNAWGQVTNVTVQVITNSVPGAVLCQAQYTYIDGLQLSCYVVNLGNLTNTYDYACCGLSSVSDPDGVNTSYAYDDLQRLITTTVARGSSSLEFINTLDAAGRVLVRQRMGNDGTTITLEQTSYDVLGRVVADTNALNGINTFTNVMIGNQLCITNIHPDSGTRIETYYADGRLQSLAGTGVHPAEYVYGAQPDIDNTWRAYAFQSKVTTNGATNEWTLTLYDGAGRAYKRAYPDGSSNLLFFNAEGQLTNEVDADGVSTLYAHNGKGERVYTVIDMHQQGALELGSSNRVTFITNDVVYDNNTYVRRTRTYVWSTLGSYSSNLLTQVEASTDGLQSWKTQYRDATTAVTNHTQTSYGSAGARTVTNTAPDGSYTVSLYSYGLLSSVTAYNSARSQIGSTSYGYDAHGRPSSVTDARNGLTTNTFNNADLVATVTTPNPGTLGSGPQTTATYYNNMLQATSTINPDGTSLYNVYVLTGELGLTYGSRVYPTGYSYDYAGRMLTMTNWQNFANNSTAEVTTWSYDPNRGFLTNKAYAGNSPGPSYTYTRAGRLQTRLWARTVGSQHLTTTYAYDNSGALSGISYNDGTTPTNTYTFDRLGRVLSVGQASSLSTFTASYSYNLANQLLTESWSGGPLASLAVTNGYDIYLRRYILQSLYQTSLLSTNNFAFDAASRLATVSDGVGNSASYSYLANSPLVSQINFTNSGVSRMITTKQYDFLNRLTSISSSGSQMPVPISYAYAYNSANQRLRNLEADGSYWVYLYDSLGQVISGHKFWSDESPVAGQQFDYAFDNIGNRTQALAGGDQNGWNQRLAAYGANNLNQYTNRTVPGFVDIMGLALATNPVTLNGTTAYRKGEYFRQQLPIGNSSSAVWTNITVSTAGQPSLSGHQFLPQTPENFSYDADGNLTQDGRWAYTWDGENRLINMTSFSNGPAGSLLKLDFTYDWQSRRIQKVVSTSNGAGYVTQSTTAFIYDGWNPVAELNATNNSILRSYVWGLDLSGTPQGAGGVGGLLELTYYGTSTTNCFPAFSANGDVGALVSGAAGSLLAQYVYGPFGEVLRATGPLAKANPLRFSTKYQDDETALVYRPPGRYLIPSIGRWATRESIGQGGAANPYSIGNCDPINYGVNDPPVFVSPPPLPNPVIPPFWQFPGKPIIGTPTPPAPPAPPRNPPGSGAPSNPGSAAGAGLILCAIGWNDIFNRWEFDDGVKICRKNAASLGTGERCCVVVLCVKCRCNGTVAIRREQAWLANMTCSQAQALEEGPSPTGTVSTACHCDETREPKYQTIISSGTGTL